MGPLNLWARSAGSRGGTASCAVGAVGGAAGGAAGPGAQNGAARVGGGACVAVLPGSGSESSEEQEGWQEYVEEVALVEEMALLAFNCPPNRFANAAAKWKPGGIPAGTATAAVELQGGDEFKHSGQLLAETVDAIEGADGAAGAVPRPIGSSNIWARSEGSGGGATGGAVGAVDGAARVGGGAGVAGSGGWTRPGTAVVVGA
eukprot:scaffold24385_cov50-Phaeocystis_antarctica.AAC.2